jgi:sarcosine oxidase subunit gamma
MSAEMTDISSASSVTRRGFHYRDLSRPGVEYRAIDGAAVAWRFGKVEPECEAARTLGIVDLSSLPRTGFKGRDTATWLAKQKVKVGEASNKAYKCGKGSLAARLAPGEVVVLGARDGSDTLWSKLESAWTFDAGLTFPVPRRESSFWFNITGDCAERMFMKICGIDLRARSFAQHDIAQTSVARTNCIIIRDDIGKDRVYHMLGDSASASYMWGCLLDAMEEFGGRPVGLEALLALK